VDKIQIATGLQVGEQVITEGADRLKEGGKVLLPGERTGGTAERKHRQRPTEGAAQ
jgi:multidrug efflux system membrane fusion protein